MKARAITEGALMAALTVIIALLSYYVPFLSVFSYLLLPLPTIVLFKRHGIAPAVSESIVASLLLLLFISPINALLLGADIILPGLFLGYGYYKDKSGGFRVMLGFFGYLFAFAIELILFEKMTGVSVTDDFINQINATTDFMTSAYQQAGLLTGSEGETLVSNIDQINETVKMLFPTMIILIPAIMSWLIVQIDDILFKRLNLSFKPVPPITEWRIPRSAKNILGLVVIISIIWGHVVVNPIYAVYPYTFEAIALFIFMIMGFAFVFWFIQRRYGKKRIFLRILIIVLCLFFPVFVSIIVFLGMADIYFDIRRFFMKREE